MRVLISGSTGLLGRRLAQALRERGDEVWTLDRHGAGAHSLTWPRTPAELVSLLPAQLHAVVHLAGAPILTWPWNKTALKRIRDSRIVTTDLLARALAAAGQPACALLAGSAIGIYRPGWPSVGEGGPLAASGFIGGLCREWEQAAQPACEAGLRVVWLRTGLVLDARGGMLAGMLPAWRLGLGGLVGAADIPWSWMHVADWVGAVCWLLDHSLEGPFNLCAPLPVRQDEAVAILGRVLGRRAWLNLPAPVISLLTGQMGRELLLQAPAVRADRLRECGFTHRFTDLEQAFHDQLRRP